jgi:hypothetical protein
MDSFQTNFTAISEATNRPTMIRPYNAFLINRQLSWFADTIDHAATLTRLWRIPAEAQYAFLISTVRKRKRSVGWKRRDEVPDGIDLICQYYGYSEKKAREVFKLFTRADFDRLRLKIESGQNVHRRCRQDTHRS